MGDVIEILTTATNTVEVEAAGPQGIPGVGVPTGGSALQVLRKKTSTDYDTEWAAAGSGSGSVTSVALASTDLTISGSPITDSGTITANIAANAVTLEKLQTISSEHLLGRHGSGNGGVQQVGLGTGLAISGSNVGVTFGSSAGTACQGNDSRLSDSRQPLSHAAAHASAGSDPLAPSDIGAQSLFTTSTITGATTLSAARAVQYDVANFGSAYDIVLPLTGSQQGDIAVFRSVNLINATVTLKYNAAPQVTIGTLTAVDQQLRFIYRASAQEWILVPVDSHPADRITSGTLAHERGGLEADVSAYNGLVKISGGSTSAVGIGTGSTEVAAGDHTHGNLTNDGKIGSTAGLPVVTTTAGAITTLALGTANQVLRVNSGATGVEFADPAASGVTGAAASASDVLGVSGSNITGVDATADRIVFWDDSASKLAYLEAGSGLSLSGTTLTATGGGVTTGSVDNAIIRADGTGGSTSQSSDLVIDDATTSTQNNVTISNQHSGQTNSALVLAPKGNGPLLGQKPNGAASGGNSRGNYATDFQRERGINTRVASGNYSVICGGFNNSATNQYAVVGSGDGNQATGSRSVIVTGDSNTASGERSFIGVGNGCTASGAYSAILSGNAAVADRASLHAHANGRFGGVNGSAQRIHGIYFGTTTTNSAVTIVNLSVPASKVIAAIINIVGVKSDGSASAHFVRRYSVKNSGGTTSEVYAAETIGTDVAASTSVTLSASDANDQLVVECTGIASETWRWVASVDAVEVSWAT